MAFLNAVTSLCRAADQPAEPAAVEPGYWISQYPDPAYQFPVYCTRITGRASAGNSACFWLDENCIHNRRAFSTPEDGGVDSQV
jgi:hypothetical protein